MLVDMVSLALFLHKEALLACNQNDDDCLGDMLSRAASEMSHK